MKIHNTLTRKTEDFKPINDQEVSIYTCGITAYDHAQIGNLRTYVFDDLLRRVLKSTGFKVNHVMNVTDIDDKTIRRSHQQYPDDDPKSALRKLTTKYEELFLQDAESLGINYSESKVVRATDHINTMQELIKLIPNKYVSDDGVYYDIAQDHKYGVLINLDRSHQHHRINNDEYDKEHVADFALWKKQDGEEPAWDFEVDGQNVKGRPGWHIECSAMSVRYLGQPFDIHTGGVDLIFPHHENEIAQSRAAAGKPLANYFVHGEHLLVDSRKMSKSLKNFFTLEDILSRNIAVMAFRLLVLQAHYRSQLNFTWESLQAAQTNLGNLYAWADQQFQPAAKSLSVAATDSFKDDFSTALQDDLNSSVALAHLNDLTTKGSPTPELLEYIDDFLGLKLTDREDITDEQKKLIEEREAARKRSDWEEADKLRSQLQKHELEINDSDAGTVWRRVS